MAKLLYQSSPQGSGTDDSLDALGSSNATRRKSSAAPRPPRRDLFEDDSGSGGDNDSEDGGAQIGESVPVFKVNEEYAQRFEHNKKREERQKCQ